MNIIVHTNFTSTISNVSNFKLRVIYFYYVIDNNGNNIVDNNNNNIIVYNRN